MSDFMANDLLAAEFPVVDDSLLPVVSGRPRWSASARFGFRFAFVYLVLFCLPSSGAVSLLSLVPDSDSVAAVLVKPIHTMVQFAAVHVFRLHGAVTQYHPTGSGDTTLDYVQVFCFLAVSLVGAVVWTAVDRRRQEYATLYAWLRVLVRYTIAITLLLYGLIKIFPLQFSTPSLPTLNERYGDSSPMHLLWTFMGASAGYRIFGGLAETISGTLLLFRRTTPLGALMGAAVMTNVVALNFFYDTPVKIYSIHIVLLCGFLLLPEVGVLANVLVLRRASLPVIEPRVHVGPRWMRWVALSAKVVILGLCCWMAVGFWKDAREAGTPPKPNELRGLWKVDSFIVGGQEVAAVSPSHRWGRLAIGRQGGWSVELVYDGAQSFKPTYAGNAATLRDTQADAKSTPDAVLSWQQVDASHIVLTGTVHGQPATIKLHGSLEDQSLLMHRGFHWINEDPYQR